MKKTLKSALSLLLALIMAFGSLSAFAAEENKKLKWDYYGDIYEYTYEGELTEGNLMLDPDETYIYYTFNCEKPGFYSFICSDENSVWVGIPDKVENDVAYDEVDYISMYPESEYITIHFIPEGENIIGLDITDVGENNELKIEYLGESLTSIDVSDELLLGDNLEFHKNDEGRFLAYMNADYEMVFSNGRTFSNDYIEFTFDEEPVNGENSLEIEILGQKSVLNVTGYYPDYFIKDISVTNPENFASTVKYYDGLDFNNAIEETVTVTFTDETTQSFVFGSEFYSVTLPNGKECWISGWFDWKDNKTVYVFGVGNNVLKTYPCKTSEANLSENIERLLQNNEWALEDVSYYFRQSLITLLECDDYDELLEYGFDTAKYYIREAATYFLSIFTNTLELLRFYI